MRPIPGPAVNRTSQRIVSLVASLAVAMTMIRLAAAKDEDARAKGRRDG
jgi:hypothetical protein